MLDVLELLAARPGGVRLADLTRELSLAKGTAHAILSTLCHRGWVTRDPMGRTFSPGPALGITAAKADSVRPLPFAARAAAVELAAELGHAVSVVERVGDVIVIVAFEGGDGDLHAAPGDRLPFGAPLGLGFAVWGQEDARRGWIERGAGTDPALARRFEDLIDGTRRRGYAVERMSPTYVHTAQLMAMLRDDLVSEPARRAIDALLADLTAIVLRPDHEAEAVTSIGAPLFDDRGRVALLLALHPNRPVSARQIEMIGRRLTSESRRVTRSVSAHRGLGSTPMPTPMPMPQSEHSPGPA